MTHLKKKYPNLPDDFRILVEKARVAKGLTLRQVGDDLGINFASVRNLETGHSNFSYERAVMFRDYFGLDYDLPIPAPEPTQRIRRKSKTSPVIRDEPFYANVDGELIEILTYRRLGSIFKASLIKGEQ